MEFLKSVWAYLKTPRFWTLFAIITISDFVFFNGSLLSRIPLIPELYKLYQTVGLGGVRNWVQKALGMNKSTQATTQPNPPVSAISGI